jgi:hypothetical protein
MKYATVLIAMSLGVAAGASAQQTPAAPAQTQSSSDRTQSSGGQPADQTNSPSNKTGQTSAGKSNQSASAGSRAFASIDKDKNGSISLTEMQRLDAKFSQTSFNSADTNRDKMISQAEYSAWQKSQATASNRGNETNAGTSAESGRADVDGASSGTSASGGSTGNTASGNTGSNPPN